MLHASQELKLLTVFNYAGCTCRVYVCTGLELLERPPYVNTGESSQFLYHLTANHMDYRYISFRIQGTEFWVEK